MLRSPRSGIHADVSPRRAEDLCSISACTGIYRREERYGVVVSLLVSINATVYVGGYKRRCTRDFSWGDPEKLNERYQRVPLRKFTSEAPPLQGGRKKKKKKKKNVARRCACIYVA